MTETCRALAPATTPSAANSASRSVGSAVLWAASTAVLLTCRCIMPILWPFRSWGMARQVGSPQVGSAFSRSPSNGSCSPSRYKPADVSMAMRDSLSRFSNGAHTGSPSPGAGSTDSHMTAKLRGRKRKLSTSMGGRIGRLDEGGPAAERFAPVGGGQVGEDAGAEGEPARPVAGQPQFPVDGGNVVGDRSQRPSIGAGHAQAGVGTGQPDQPDGVGQLGLPQFV